jgi:hypothetical protein
MDTQQGRSKGIWTIDVHNGRIETLHVAKHFLLVAISRPANDADVAVKWSRGSRGLPT